MSFRAFRTPPVSSHRSGSAVIATLRPRVAAPKSIREETVQLARESRRKEPAARLTERVAQAHEARGGSLRVTASDDGRFQFDVLPERTTKLGRLAKRLFEKGGVSVRADFAELRSRGADAVFSKYERAVWLNPTSFIEGVAKHSSGPHELFHAWALWRTRPHPSVGSAKAPPGARLPGGVQGPYGRFMQMDEPDAFALSMRVELVHALNALARGKNINLPHLKHLAEVGQEVSTRATEIWAIANRAVDRKAVRIELGAFRHSAQFDLGDRAKLSLPLRTDDVQALQAQVRWARRAALHRRAQFQLAGEVIEQLGSAQTPQQSLKALQRVFRQRSIERDPRAVIFDLDDARAVYQAALRDGA